MFSARDQGIVRDEWQALLDLGLLWAGRDYLQTGEYYRQAYGLAQSNGDPSMLAHALNRLANWHTNLDETDQARQFHLRALEIFEKIQDRVGTAETLDLLGMTSFLSGNLIDGKNYLDRAIVLFRQMGDPRLLISSLTVISLCTTINQTDTMIYAQTSGDSIRSVEESLAIARASGNRAGESFGLFVMAQIMNYRGQYGLALEAVSNSIGIAEEIQHRQWTCAGYFGLGTWNYYLFRYQPARESFEKALTLATELGSKHWQLTAGAMIGRTLVAMGSLKEAQEFLEGLGVDKNLPTSLGARIVRLAQAELALAKGDPSGAIQILDRMKAQTPHLAEKGEQAAFGLSYTRARALHAQGSSQDAVDGLNALLNHILTVGAGTMEWRVRALLTACYRSLSQIAAAEEQARLAKQIVEKLATTVSDEQIRSNFIRCAQIELHRASS